MTTIDPTTVLPALFSELVYGSPDPTVGTYMLNRGDQGLLKSLDATSATEASTAVGDGGSIAAHTDHIRYGLALLNRWASGEPAPWKNADWTLSWKKPTVTDAEWRTLRDDLHREVDAWHATLGTSRDYALPEIRWVAGSVAHLAYHLGAIRQISRSTRGPTAEDERAFQTG